MDVAQENSIQLKIFIGFEINPDLNMHLKQSLAWKEISAGIRDDKQDYLVQVRFNDKEYIGGYLKHSIVPLKEVRNYAKQMQKMLQEYCGKCNIAALKVRIFSQIFVT